MSDSLPATTDVATLGIDTLPFVGRDAEFGVLTDMLACALAGEGRTVLVSGEPGIGKTRLAGQIAALARVRGARVLWGNCYEWEGAPPFWPWAQIFNAWLRPLADDTLRQALGANATLIAQITPEIAVRLTDLPQPPTMSPEARLFRLLAAASATLRQASQSEPLVIVLDDVHWADKPSLQLLHFLSREIHDAPILLIATFRPMEVDRGHPAVPVLADLARETNCRRLTLRGLPRPQIARFMALIAGSPQPPEIVEAVEEETAGNPFFVTEVVRLLVEEGRLGVTTKASAPLSHVPESAREAIRRRLDRLSALCNHALGAASVIGREFDLRLLEPVARIPAIELLGALDEALRTQLLVPLDDSTDGYRFAHALVQETLYDELPAAERARLHLAAGEALTLQMGDRQPPWETLAHHFHHALPLGDPARVSTCAERAGESAFARFAWDAAVVHFRRALDALDRSGTTDKRRRCDLLLALGEAHNRAGSGSGDVPAAREILRQAFDLAHALGYPNGMARAAVEFAGLNIVGAFGGIRQVEMLEEALVALDTSDSALRVRVLGRLAVDLHNRSFGGNQRCRELADEAVAIADRLGDPAAQAFAQWARYNAYSTVDDAIERARVAKALRLDGERAAEPLFIAWGYLLGTLSFLELGDLLAAEQSMAELDTLVARARIPYASQRAAAYRGMLDLLRGRYPEAEQQIAQARDLWQSDAPRQHWAQEYALLSELGRLDEFVDEMVVVPDELHTWRPAAQANRMGLALARGDRERARFDYDALVAGGFFKVLSADVRFSVAVRLTDAAIFFDDRAVIDAIYDSLLPAAGQFGIDGRLAICYGPVSLVLGRLATALERWPQAEEHLSSALDTSRRAGLRPFIARSLLAQATLHMHRREPGDRRMARALAQHALEEAEAIGMHGLAPGCQTLLAELTPRHDGRFGLTPRELEVIQLLAEGLTDAAIAERLSLSSRTINSHLTSIYTKLDVSSRLAATQMAATYELI